MVVTRTKCILTFKRRIFVACVACCLGPILTSCSQLGLISKGSIPVFANDHSDHHKLVTITGKKEAYLWGMIAPDSQLIIDEVFYRKGHRSVADIKMKEWQTTGDVLATFFSLGFYLPRRYRVTARVMQ